MEIFLVLLPFYILFILWLGFRIIQKAGFEGWWVLLIPFANIIMIWAFAFLRWPTLKAEVKQEY